MVSQVVQFDPGQRLIDGNDLNKNFGLYFGASSGLTAKAGGGQSLATPLLGATNEVAVCATGSDSVVLPPATTPGQAVAVINNGAQTLAIFASAGTDRIVPTATIAANALANGTAATLASGVMCEFFCYKPGFWKQETSV